MPPTAPRGPAPDPAFDELFLSYPREQASLLPLLQAIQERDGFLTAEMLHRAAAYLFLRDQIPVIRSAPV